MSHGKLSGRAFSLAPIVMTFWRTANRWSHCPRHRCCWRAPALPAEKVMTMSRLFQTKTGRSALLLVYTPAPHDPRELE